MIGKREDKDFFSGDVHMSPYGENGVLFTSYYVRLLRLKDHYFYALDTVAAQKAIDYALHFQLDNPLSHDNMTGIVCLSKDMELGYHSFFKHRDYWRRAHPRDVAFYLYAMGGVYKLLSYGLLWFTMLSMMWACWHRQISNGKLDTDGKLLAWLRFETFDWKFSRWICTKIIGYRHGLRWSDIFEIYFGHVPNHPNVREAKQIYG